MGELVQDGTMSYECLCHDHILENNPSLLVEYGKSIHISIAAKQTRGKVGELSKDTKYIEV